MEEMDELWALGPNDVLRSGSNGLMRWDGTGWTLVSPQPPFQGTIRGSADDDIWILKNYSSIVHWDGATWTDLSIDLSTGSHAWSSWVSARDEAWMAVATPSASGNSQPAIYHLKGGTWSQVPSPLDALTNVYLGAMWGSGPNDVWAGGDQAELLGNTAVLLHWNGGVWESTSAAALQESGQIIEDLWGTSSTDVWAAGGGVGSGFAELWHFDGSGWTEATVPGVGEGYFGPLWGSCPSDYWALGPGPGSAGPGSPSNTLWHYDGSAWSIVTQTISIYASGRMTTVQPAGRPTGTGPDDVWTMGSNPTMCFQQSLSFLLHRQPSRCGDGTIGPGEQCDPPRQGPDGPQCDATCHLLTCGNGVVDPGEQCDPPTTGRCDQNCQFPTCGNGVVDPGEDCDPPNTSTCDSQCHSIPIVCGNGVVQSGETCDLPDGTFCHSCQITCCGSCFNAMSLGGVVCGPSNPTGCDQSCQTATEVCTTLSGTARTNCQAALTCMVPNLGQCAAAIGPLGCYCSDSTCSAGANGRCSAQIQAVTQTTDLTEIKRQFSDWSTTLGRLGLEVSAFGESNCARACANGVSVCGYP